MYIRDLVADGRSLVRKHGVGGGGQNSISSQDGARKRRVNSELERACAETVTREG